MNRIILMLALLSTSALASTTSITATLTDSDAVTWANCTWSANLFSPRGGPTINGVSVSLTFAGGTCNSSGVMSTTLTDTTSLDQASAYWLFTIQPNASVGPSLISTVVSGGSESLSAILSAGLKVPRFNPSVNAYGYANVEALTPVPGSLYFNVSIGEYCQFGKNLAWVCSSPNGTATITGGTTNGTTGTFGFQTLIAGDTNATPSTFTQITSTNSGSTLGIPSGYGCSIGTTFVSGSNYSSFAICMSNATSGTNGNMYIYNFVNSPLGSSYTNRAEIDHNGGFYGLLFQGGSFNSTANQTTVNCSTSGSATFSQPFQGSSDKRVLIHFSASPACTGTASYNFPTAFTNTPSVYTINNVAATIATSVSTTAVTVTGATTTGSLVLEDY